MWNKIAGVLIRQRFLWLLLLGIGTLFMGSHIPNVRLQYQFGGLLPATDSTAIAYEEFKSVFGTEGNVMVIGSELPPLQSAEALAAWDGLAHSIRTMEVVRDTTDDGVDNPVLVPLIDSVFCMTAAFDVVRDTADRRFLLRPLLPDSIWHSGLTDEQSSVFFERLFELPFYEGLLYNERRDATLMTVFMDPELFDSKHRGTLVEDVTALTDEWSEVHGIPLYLSGLPFIRVEMTNKVKEEIGYFIGAAFAVTALLLFLFFRNLIVMGVSMVVVGIGVVWSIGSLVLLDYELNLMTSLIPPLMIVIGVPNCIYLVNKYHAEYKRHGIKARALQRMVVKVGNATLLTNFTTALGFATFIFTHSQMLKQFGVVTALNILGMFVISIVVIPALMAGLPAPKTEHTRHLDRRWMFTVVNKLVHFVEGQNLHRCSPGFAIQLYGHRANADHWQHRGRHPRPRPCDPGFAVGGSSIWRVHAIRNHGRHPSPRGCHQQQLAEALGPLAKRFGRLPRVQPLGKCGRCDEVCIPSIQKRPPEKLPTPADRDGKDPIWPLASGVCNRG
jgi:predicted RND superfamily exporter protein